MLVVRVNHVAYFNPRLVQSLYYACKEVVPAALNTWLSGRLSPGAIQFAPKVVPEGLLNQVLVDVEADYHIGRALDLGYRNVAIMKALNVLFPEWKIDVRTKLVRDKYSSSVAFTGDFSGSMLMSDAIKRYKEHAVDRIKVKV